MIPKRVKINSRKNIQVRPKEYKACARGGLSTLKQSGIRPGDRLSIREHTGTKYTGKEILATATKVKGDQVTFQKIAILTDDEETKKNSRDEKKKGYQTKAWNNYI